MALSRRHLVVDSDDFDDTDDFPSLRQSRPAPTDSKKALPPTTHLQHPAAKTPRTLKVREGSTPRTTIRRRKLGNLTNDNSLLRPFGARARDGAASVNTSLFDVTAEINLPHNSSPEPQRPRRIRPRIELRTRKSRGVSEAPSDDSGELSTQEASVLEDVTLEEDGLPELNGETSVSGRPQNGRGMGQRGASILVEGHLDRHRETQYRSLPSSGNPSSRKAAGDPDESTDEDVGASGVNLGREPEGLEATYVSDSDEESDASEFEESSGSDEDFSADSIDDYLAKTPPRRSAGIATRTGTTTKTPSARSKNPPAKPPPKMPSSPTSSSEDDSLVFFSADESFRKSPPTKESKKSAATGVLLTKPGKVQIGVQQEEPTKPGSTQQPSQLPSPTKKLPRIPQTPHRPTADAFWDQGLVDEWNMEHSPRKILSESGHHPKAKAQEKPKKTSSRSLLADTSKNVGTPAMSSPKKAQAAAVAKEKEAKKLFQQSKHDVAQQFLGELDRTITDGELGRLANGTGGIRIEWNNKLNTTAGRANWRRETLRHKLRDHEDAASAPPPRVLHHASIELAEKVIDDEHRLLNVIAHEFCHLANFMVSGVTGNPHGKEFKAWAALCSRHFGERGIQVTTKHSYEIDFKYVWSCEVCATEFKRHSRSIDPARHRCGACKGTLKQIKPTPRGAGARSKGSRAGSTGVSTGPSEYQKFMKEHMVTARRENPGSPQKLIMKIVAEKWTKAKALKLAPEAESSKSNAGPGAAQVSGMDQLDRAFIDLTL